VKVFKFGGASVKDAAAVKNVASVLSLFKGERLVVVISAMGKMTNALENIVNAYWNKADDLPALLQKVKDYHTKIIEDLGFNKGHGIYGELDSSMQEINWILEEEPIRSYAFAYDQVVS